MSKAAITSLILDLKLTPDGRVVILEFGDIYRSAYSGYKRLTGESILSKAFHFYESWGIPVYQDGKGSKGSDYRYKETINDRLGVFPLETKDGFRSDSISTYGGILLGSKFMSEKERRALTDPPFDRVLATNAHGLINACAEDKVILAALAGEFVPDLFPEQKLYPVDKWQRMDVGQILRDFCNEETVVIKNARQSNAAGVGLLNLRRLRTMFNLSVGSSYLNFFAKPSFYAGDVSIIQKYEEGKLITAENAKGETGEYDPTMRVILTAYHDQGETKVVCHEAYYKVPAKPVSSKMDRGSRISKVSADKGPKSAFVPEEDKRHVFARLEERLPALLGPLLTTPSHVFADRFLDSEDEALKRVGYHIATKSSYFDRPADLDGYPCKLAQKAFALRGKMPEIDRLLLGAETKRKPAGLPELFKELSQSSGTAYKPKRSKGPFYLVGGVAGVFAVIFTLSGVSVEKLLAEKLDTMFLAEEGRENFRVPGLDNLKLYELDENRSYMNSIRKSVASYASVNAYEACMSGRWDEQAQRLFPAFKMALENPDENFVKVDFYRTERIEKDGMVISENLITDTYIYGTECPDVSEFKVPHKG